ncbi:MAG TPA: ATP-binding cassette domain-containing protein, partial [Roseiarcus sp.]|nr:ATP-binding cassette domain-containing protein [Roseiarcus sp.]
MAEPRRSEVNIMLQVRGLNVYYGYSHALQGVDLTLEHGLLSVVGRNGMGKTTLCKAIIGLVRASSGTVRMRGQELLGLPPAAVARLGVGYVPQGRRLWRSLTVDEHLRMTQARERGAWTVERVYDTFPRLAERRNNGGGQLSGGEQQMLAISRALVTNPRLLIMDEPTEGLAPVIVSQVEEMLLRLGEETDMAILVIEQNIGVATTVSENVAIMVNGRINRIIESRRLAADRELQQRLLGVGRHAEAIEPEPSAEQPSGSAPRPARAAKPSGAPVRIYVSNPAPPTRWSQPTPNARIESAARIASASAARTEATPPPSLVSLPSGPPVVIVAGTLDTKGEELRFIRDLIVAGGLRARLVDVSTSGKPATCDVTAQEVALNHGRGGS